MNTTSTPGFKSADFKSILGQATHFALQWRLLVLWIVILLIPTIIMTFPLWQILSAQLNNSVYAPALANHLTMNAVNDIMYVMSVNKLMLQGASIGAMIFTLLLSPFLSGAIVTAARAVAGSASTATPLTMGKLVHGGIAEYWRMVRMMLCAIIPFAIAGAIIAGVMHMADGYTEKAIQETNADFVNRASLVIMIVLLLIADATVEAGRAQFVHSTVRRSAIKAWWKGLLLVVKRPLSTLGFYVVITLIGLVFAAIFGMLRLHIGHVSTPGFIIGLIFTQLIVASTAWMKGARLFALAAISK